MYHENPPKNDNNFSVNYIVMAFIILISIYLFVVDKEVLASIWLIAMFATMIAIGVTKEK